MAMAQASGKQCHRCGRVFARTEHLQRHERSHTKEKPFGCLICSKAFTRKDLLKRHNHLVHEPAPEWDESSEPSKANKASSATVASQPLNSARYLGQPIASRSSNSDDFLPLQDSQITLAAQPMPMVDYGALRAHQPFNENALWTSTPEYAVLAAPYEGDDFSSFVDSIGFPSNPFSPSFQPVPDWPSELPEPDSAASRPQRTEYHDTNTTVEDLEIEGTPWASRMPSVQRGAPVEATRRSQRHLLTGVSSQCRNAVIEKLRAYSSVVTKDFVLPSRHTLTCFVNGYATVFNEHYPLLHLPTLQLDSLSPDLFLALSSLGAQYYWERAKGLELFHVARAVVFERLRGRSTHAGLTKLDRVDTLHAAQALLLLIAVSTWSEAGKSEAFALRGLLEELLHAESLDLKTAAQHDSWLSWKQNEEVKRTKLIAYCFFNLQTITFDVPPMLLYSDIKVDLACSERLWRADNEDEWRQTTLHEEACCSFTEAFQALFDSSGKNIRGSCSRSPLSGHTLLQAIIQHIWLLQQARNLPEQPSLASTEAASAIELALKRWRSLWENDDSVADASGPDGPMPFTSRALLRLAYIRINIDSGSSRSIGSWNPDEIARSLHHQQPVQRNDKITRVALHCAQGLGIPIKLGINFVAHTQVFYWSNQYALCSLECALLLTKWLEAVAVPHPVPSLTDKEKRLLDFVVQLVNHTEYEAPRTILLRNNKYLGIVVLRLWAKLFREDSVWSIVDLIGKSMKAYADQLEREMGQDIVSDEHPTSPKS